MAQTGDEEVLPIEALRERVEREIEHRPIVVSSPTGSGKSTQVPRWLAAREPPVLVVEPRRVACRSLASRVADLEGVRVGTDVGFHVRDHRAARDDTRILFATPGIVLRTFDRIGRFSTVILDELHERGLETDLLLALLKKRFDGHLVAMSATLDGDRVARYLGGEHLSAEGRLHPVEVRYLPGEGLLPDRRGVEDRVRDALEAAATDPGDLLVFLPGKAEIAAVADSLEGRRDLDVVPLHGGLSLEQQGRAFASSKRRKVVLATNVAETSITLPGIGVVVDAGLVRRTRFHRDRGFLTLVPIAEDSATQRAGRAGRLGPGVCYRLWSEAAKLEPTTPPEIHRESLVSLLLSAAACGERAEDLEMLDAPKPHALASAREELLALGALSDSGAITERGKRVFGLPLDAHLGRLLVEALDGEHLTDVIDVVSVLAVGRPLFVGERPLDERDDLRAAGCDVTALVRAVRSGDPRRHHLSSFTLAEARRIAKRLRSAFDLGADRADPDERIDREAIARIALAADPRCAHVARRRKGKRADRVSWSNGGTEIELGRESAVANQSRQSGVLPPKAGAGAPWSRVEAIAVLDSRAIGLGKRDTRVLATCATPLRLSWLAKAGLGRDRAASAELKRGIVVARVERVYARKVIDEREEVPRGAVAREAIRELVVRGRLFPDAFATTKDRLVARSLASRLDMGIEAPPPVEEWLEARLAELGVENGEDVALLAAADLVAEDLPYEVRAVLDKDWPRRVDLGDCTYEVDYDLSNRQVILRMVRGTRDKPPPLAWLPRFEGFRICVEAGRSMHVLRER